MPRETYNAIANAWQTAPVGQVGKSASVRNNTDRRQGMFLIVPWSSDRCDLNAPARAAALVAAVHRPKAKSRGISPAGATLSAWWNALRRPQRREAGFN
jgi:hypothetical protein